MVDKSQKAEAVFQYFEALGLPTLQLASIDICFSEEEVWGIIRDLPIDKAPGPDDFMGLFYNTTYPIIKQDVLNAFNAFWSLDSRNFHLVNEAYMILLRKKECGRGN